MYSYRTENSVSKKLKGIKKAVLKKEISFEDYKNCLFNQKEYFHRQKVIRSHKHDIFTEVGKMIKDIFYPILQIISIWPRIILGPTTEFLGQPTDIVIKPPPSARVF
jgi:hypothetical protein